MTYHQLKLTPVSREQLQAVMESLGLASLAQTNGALIKSAFDALPDKQPVDK